MKRLIPILYIAILFVTPASAQLFYAEDGEISNLQVSRANGEVTVTMNIDITNITVGRDETIILTPIVTDDSHRYTMPSIELMGRRAYLYYLREDGKSQTEQPFAAQRVDKRAEKRDGERQVLEYEARFAFEEWMRGSMVAIREGLCGCGKLRGESETPVAEFGHQVYVPEYVWSFVAPDPEPVKVRNESHSAYINFHSNRYEILESYRNNSSELAGILASISKVDEDEDLSITSITIEGWASPEATEEHNKTLSHNRAQSLANYVSKHTGIARERIEAVGCGEDWAGLRHLVEATPGLLHRDKVFAIIDREDIGLDHKNTLLAQLKPNTIYQRLMNEMYPKLRRNDYKIVYEVRNFDINEARQLIYSDPKKLSVEEIYTVAHSYEVGSAEYCHAVEVAAEHYPDVVAAAVNAAELALRQGDKAKARAILERCTADDARLIAALGYLSLDAGNYDEARTLLQRAAAAGNKDAAHNLAELERYLASL